MYLWVWKPVCIVFLGISDAKWYQPWAVGDGLHAVQLCPFTASSHSASHIPDPPMQSPAAFYSALWTQDNVLHSIRQGCLKETMLSGQICVMSDTVAGREDLLKPWKTSQCAAARLCSCEHAPAVKRALWPQTRPGTTLGISTAQGCLHLQSCRFKYSLTNRP